MNSCKQIQTCELLVVVSSRLRLHIYIPFFSPGWCSNGRVQLPRKRQVLYCKENCRHSSDHDDQDESANTELKQYLQGLLKHSGRAMMSLPAAAASVMESHAVLRLEALSDVVLTWHNATFTFLLLLLLLVLDICGTRSGTRHNAGAHLPTELALQPSKPALGRSSNACMSEGLSFVQVLVEVNNAPQRQYHSSKSVTGRPLLTGSSSSSGAPSRPQG